MTQEEGVIHMTEGGAYLSGHESLNVRYDGNPKFNLQEMAIEVLGNILTAKPTIQFERGA